MKERPILFTGAMVRAILAGTKSQTRRLVKPQPDFCADPVWTYRHHSAVPRGKALREGWYVHEGEYPEEGAEFYRCPYGQSGDRLWVRETVAIEHWTREFGDEPPIPKDRPWKHKPAAHFEDCERWCFPHYRATDPAPDLSCEREDCKACESGDPSPHWTPSIHMPRWASRLTLEITDVRVQRLREITPADAVAEGCCSVVLEGDLAHLKRDAVERFGTDNITGERYIGSVGTYAALWESINGAGSWDANPWVWAITFTRTEVAHV